MGEAEPGPITDTKHQRLIGPARPAQRSEIQVSYGANLRPGEAEGMAAFVQQAVRIPRRGEIGLSGEQIEAYQRAGFVMSGDQHKRMTAVRLRKENQVLSAEQARELALEHQQERERRENEMIQAIRTTVAQQTRQIYKEGLDQPESKDPPP